MNVVVFGAGGKTGSLVVERAVAAGHLVTLFLREAPTQLKNPSVRFVTGDAGDLAAVRKAISGQDAVIDTIGGKTPYKDTEIERNAARNIITAMQEESVRRLIVISMMGIGESSGQAPFWYEHLLMPTFLRGSTKDKIAMEASVQASGLDFVIARPPILTDDAATGSVTIVPAGSKGHKITRGDLAQFLVDQITGTQYLGQAVVIANS
jgi:nucleoside-diphosphate-sugar epimerase